MFFKINISFENIVYFLAIFLPLFKRDEKYNKIKTTIKCIKKSDFLYLIVFIVLIGLNLIFFKSEKWTRKVKNHLLIL